ncbi:MAG: DsrE family protein [Geminicoccaceae bacterium]|nr:DsrE family protein [Geminicoccaceae bacterium]MCS7269090.1 DsrE family protein [Geminicoccaceae bacterium]MCX7630826.1 DsrE family protein [Geminicoccaceae bacterium]MDW8125886.1 DsrE family protein [Geminicoccaceae bacterium]MDW8341931.1 DsrE family protein [Geminicoccaceae bacterium]
MGRRLSRRLVVPALAGAAAAPVAARAAGEPFKVVYHLNQPGGENFAYYRQMLVNIRNHLSIRPPEGIDIRVVMHGPGVDLLRRAATADQQIAAVIDELKLAGVKFLVCKITLERNNIPLAELYDTEESDLVPSGVFEIARLQQREGFAYLKI